MISSTVEFTAMASEYGLDAVVIGKLVEAGFDTIANFANSCDYVPGVSTTGESFTKEVILPVLGREDHPKRAALRRLFNDSYALCAANTARLVTHVPGETPQPLPVHEPEARRETLQGRLGGIDMSGDNDPSNAPIDKAHDL